jgi:sulfopyruvate decarboxylase TPP-binding subunit
MLIAIPDKLLCSWLKDQKYISPADEGEAVGIGIGYFLATGKAATVAMSADGFCNALSPITSHVIPFNIKMKLVISVGRKEAQHVVMSGVLEDIVKLLRKKNKGHAKNITLKLIRKKS